MVSTAFLVGCAGKLPQVPDIGTPGLSLPGKVVWHDLITPDPLSAREFYSGLLGWTFEELTSGYAIAWHQARPVAGIGRSDASGSPGHWLPLLSVTDVDAALSFNLAEGGSTALRPIEVPGRGRVAVLRDPQQAAVGIVHSPGGDPAEREPVVNEWLWDEVWTEDVPSAMSFYQGLVGGLEVAQSEVYDDVYDYLVAEGKPRFGFLDNSEWELKNTWVSYILVEDVEATVAKVEALGGKVLLAPSAAVRDGTVAIITDPTGAGLVLQEREQ